MAKISPVCGDLNDHIGLLASYEGVQGGYGYDLRNKENEYIPKLAVAHNLVAGNSLFHQERQPSGNLPVRWY